MTYLTQEDSIESGAPYFLYEFVTTNLTYRFTDYIEDVTFASDVYSKLPIKHSEIKQSREISKNSVKLTIPLTGDFANLFLGWSPDSSISVTIRRGHFGAADTLVYWKGRIISHLLKQKELELTSESIFTSMRQAGLRARFQRSCRHVLYSQGTGKCNVTKADFAVAGEVTALANNVVTISSAAGYAAGWFTAGILEFADGSYRFITNHSGSAVSMFHSSRYVTDGIASSGYGNNYGLYYGGIGVTLYPGCDKTLATCISKFSNEINQGGFRWIPTINPMGGSSIV